MSVNGQCHWRSPEALVKSPSLVGKKNKKQSPGLKSGAVMGTCGFGESCYVEVTNSLIFGGSFSSVA